MQIKQIDQMLFSKKIDWIYWMKLTKVIDKCIFIEEVTIYRITFY